MPGDALEVTIVRLTPSREIGWTRYPLAPNVVDPDRAAHLPDRETAEWAIDVAAETVRLIEPPPALAPLALPLEPMIGCFGVAPADGEAISTSTPGPHGGNMDWRGFRPGTIVWFPVSVPGALFFAGDGHARQGDGEISGTGVEVSMEMELRLESTQAMADPLAAWHHLGWRRAVHRGQCPAPRPGTAARHYRDARLAGVRLRARYRSRQPPHGADRRLRRGQRLQPGLHGHLPDASFVSREVEESRSGRSVGATQVSPASSRNAHRR